MDLRQRLTRWAHAHPRALLVDVPGRDALRWAVEDALDEKGWELAASPADTDVLIVVGEPAPALADAIDVLWSQVPKPRHAIVITEPEGLERRLDAAIDGLVASSASRTEDPSGADPAAQLAAAPGPSQEGMNGAHDMAGHGDHDMAGDEGHHMHHGGMVAGLPMAQTGQDRDGLELDTLGFALGPVLPGWPGGLVLRAQLQGDVLSDVRLSWLVDGREGVGRSLLDDSQMAALDHLARLLVVAGWPTQARLARRARAGLRSPDPAVRARAQQAASRVVGQVRRSRTLAWSVRGMGPLPQETRPGRDVGESSDPHDVLAKLRQWCDRAEQRDLPPAVPVTLAALSAVLEGAELAAARLVVASVSLDPVGAVSEEGMTSA